MAAGPCPHCHDYATFVALPVMTRKAYVTLRAPSVPSPDRPLYQCEKKPREHNWSSTEEYRRDLFVAGFKV